MFSKSHLVGGAGWEKVRGTGIFQHKWNLGVVTVNLATELSDKKFLVCPSGILQKVFVQQGN